MRRRLSILLVSLSLLACLAFSNLWFRSGFVRDSLSRNNGSQLLMLCSAAGLMGFAGTAPNPPRPTHASRWVHETSLDWEMAASSMPVWHWEWLPSTSTVTLPTSELATAVTIHEARLPYWIPTFVTSLLPLLWLRRWAVQRWRPLRRQRAGLCLHCGYDLRASNERCPECGTAVPAQIASSGGKA